MAECKKAGLVNYEIEYLRGKVGQEVGWEDGAHIFVEETCGVKDCSFSTTFFCRVENGKITKI